MIREHFKNYNEKHKNHDKDHRNITNFTLARTKEVKNFEIDVPSFVIFFLFKERKFLSLNLQILRCVKLCKTIKKILRRNRRNPLCLKNS